MTEIFAIRLIEASEFVKHKDTIVSFLPDDISQRLLRFKSEVSMQRSMLGELLSRSVLSWKSEVNIKEINIYKGEQGKPYLADYANYFNVSHSGDWVVLAISDQEVGIDIEKIRKVDFRIAERYFSEEEKNKLFKLEGDKKTKYFLDLWTLKESYLKLLGKGLTKSLSTFTIVGENGNFHLLHDEQIDHNVNFRQFKVDETHKTSVCAYSSNINTKIQILKIEELIPYPAH
jgi:4'-phosphopantetheinyl transferase